MWIFLSLRDSLVDEGGVLESIGKPAQFLHDVDENVEVDGQKHNDGDVEPNQTRYFI